MLHCKNIFLLFAHFTWAPARRQPAITYQPLSSARREPYSSRCSTWRPEVWTIFENGFFTIWKRFVLFLTFFRAWQLVRLDPKSWFLDLLVATVGFYGSESAPKVVPIRSETVRGPVFRRVGPEVWRILDNFANLQYLDGFFFPWQWRRNKGSSRLKESTGERGFHTVSCRQRCSAIRLMVFQWFRKSCL